MSVLLVANEQLLHSPLSPSATSRNPKIRFRQPSVDLEVSPSVSGASELSPDFPSSEAFSSSSEESESSPEASEERPISYTDLTSTIAQSCCSVAPMSIQNGGTKIVRYQHGEDSEAELMENFSGRRKSPESPESPEGRILDNGDLDEINDASDNTEMNKVGNVEEMPELDVPITHETCGSAPNEPKTPDKNDQTAVKENEVEEDNEDNMDSNEETVVKINENTEDTDDNKEGFAENEETDDVAVKANEEESGEDDRDNSKEQQEDDVAVVKENEETEEHGDRERTDEQISGEEESAVDVVTVVEINSNPKETRREESEDYQIIQDSPTGEREEVEIQDEIESTGEEHEGTEVQHSQEEAVMVEEEESMEKLNSAELFATEDHLVAHLTNESAIDEFLPHCHGVLTQSLTESEVKSLAIVASAPESRTGDNKPEEQRLLRTKSVEPTDSKKKKRGTTQSPSKRPLVPKPPEGQQARMSRRLRAVHSTNLGGQIELGENRSRAKSHSPAKGSTPKFLQDRPSLEAVERHKRKEEEKKTAEEQKLAEEKEKKRKEAEEAFKSWLRRKNEEIRRAKSTERDVRRQNCKRMPKWLLSALCLV